MANKHFDRVSRHMMATIMVRGSEIPCTIFDSKEGRAQVRVVTTGGIPEHVALVRDGKTRRARVALRKQGPLGVDLWLKIEAATLNRAA